MDDGWPREGSSAARIYLQKSKSNFRIRHNSCNIVLFCFMGVLLVIPARVPSL